MTSELEYLDKACEMTVLPQPKAPGMAVVPPWTQLWARGSIRFKVYWFSVQYNMVKYRPMYTSLTDPVRPSKLEQRTETIK